MKAVVLEIKEKWAAVLCEDGVIRKVKKGNFKVGDSFDFEVENHKKVVSIGSLRRNMVGSAAALFLIVVGVAGTYSYNNVLACSYVSLDINPSIEYTLNRQDKVVAVKGLNNDGQEIADELISVRKVTLKEALKETKQLLTQKNYLKSGSSEDVLIDISANNSARKDTLKKEALSVFDTEQTKGELNLVLTESDLKEHKQTTLEFLQESINRFNILRLNLKMSEITDMMKIKLMCYRLRILPYIRITLYHNFWNLQDRERL